MKALNWFSGLSYSSFFIGEGKLSGNTFSSTEPPQLTIPVTNPGKYDRTEIVQAYGDKINRADGPIKNFMGI